MRRLHIASDHAGFSLKNVLAKNLGEDLEIIDVGAYSEESCDYPVYAKKLCEAVSKEKGLGILVCGTGIGMSIIANRHAGIRAALCTSELQASLGRRHNNANVLCLGARITGEELALAIARAFLAGEFEGGRHQRRLDMIDK